MSTYILLTIQYSFALSIMFFVLMLRIKRTRLLRGCLAVGAMQKVLLDDDVKGLIQQELGVNVQCGGRFLRAVMHNNTFCSSFYTRAKKRNSYCVSFRSVDGQLRFGLIKYLLELPTCCVAVLTPLSSSSHQCYPSEVGELRRFIIPVQLESTSVIVSPVHSIVRKCLLIDFCTDRLFVVNVPSCHKYD